MDDRFGRGVNNMKIIDVKTYLLSPKIKRNFLFVKVETDTGISGWGECHTKADSEKVTEMYVLQLKRYVIGRDPLKIKNFTMVAYNDFTIKRGSMHFHSAVSGIEQALWDIAGKYFATPVYNLLGGPCREKIRVYANGWYNLEDTFEEQVQAAKNCLEMGFTALKFDPFPKPYRIDLSKEEERLTLERIEIIRSAVGYDVDLLIEVHRRLAPYYAIRFADKLADLNPFWYEEPVSVQNIDALLEVKNAVGLCVVTGEELYSKADFRVIFERKAAQVINPDIGSCGGILELKEIAAMAEPYCVLVAPHTNSTTVGLAATVQLSAAIPNFLIAEYFVNLTKFGHMISSEPIIVEAGHIKIPDRPGLGLELNEEIFNEFPYEEFPKRNLPVYYDEK